MKKSYRKLILLVGLGILILGQSCSDWLNLLPEDDLVTDEFWMSQEDVESVLFNTYGVFAGEVKTLLMWGELRGGLLSEGRNVPSDAAKILMGDINETNSYTNWSNLYKVINGANQILEYAPPVVDRDPSFSKIELNQILSEALYLRAISYFYLVRTFKDVPLILIPYTTDEQDYYPEKSTEQVILDQIILDLNRALDNAALSYNSTESTKGRVTKYAVHALLADVNLWMDNYQETIDQCSEIINSGKYALLGEANWFENFYPGNSNSSIFEIQFSKSWGTTPGLYETFSYQKNRQFIINARIIELFDPDDVRGLGATYSNQNLEIWKYVGINPLEERGDAFNDNNFIIYRLADIKLMQAEAMIELNDFESAAGIINEIRLKRGLDEISIEPSTEAFEDELLKERARELTGEGKYWFDLLRIGKRNNYERKEKVIEALILNASAETILALQVKFQDPYSWYMPISRDELQINLNLIQNPYYQN
jgi:hypothetical protein